MSAMEFELFNQRLTKKQGIPLDKSNLKRISFYGFFLTKSKLIITDIGLRQLTQSKQINHRLSQHCGFDYLYLANIVIAYS